MEREAKFDDTEVSLPLEPRRWLWLEEGRCLSGEVEACAGDRLAGRRWIEDSIVAMWKGRKEQWHKSARSVSATIALTDYSQGLHRCMEGGMNRDKLGMLR